jgi:hypothetical protein
MTRNDIIRMAREAGLLEGGTPAWVLVRIEAFAALVAAAEREACAKACETQYPYSVMHTDQRAATNCAAAIRARGQT